mgnify:CR=1 FL=1
MSKPLNISEEAKVQMPMKTVVSLIAMVAIGTWAYFGIVEKLNKHDTAIQLMISDLDKNTDFRIKWPRGQLGSLPADSEQFMLIEDLYKQVDKLTTNQEINMSNKLRIEFIAKMYNGKWIIPNTLIDLEENNTFNNNFLQEISINDKNIVNNELIKNISIPKGLELESIDLKKAQFLCSLPKSIGVNPDNQKEITLNTGRFGPYLKCENKSARIENIEEIFSIGLNRAITMIAEAKPGRISSSLIKDDAHGSFNDTSCIIL